MKKNNSLLQLIFTLAVVTISGFLTNRASAQGTLTPPGAPSPTMKSLAQIEPRTPISSLPFTIGPGSSGSYYVTTNLTGTNGQNGIVIYSGNVTLDLGGFTLQGVPGSVMGVQIGAALTNIIIRNGTITGWGSDGIGTFATLQNTLVQNIVASDNFTGIYIYSGEVLNCIAFSNHINGIVANGYNVLVKDCVAQFNNNGIIVSEGGIIKSCSAFNNAQTGIQAGPDGSVSDSIAGSISGGIGITLNPGSVAQNCISITNGTGIWAQYASQVLNCTTRANSTSGIQADSGTRIIGDLVENSGPNGIFATGTNAVIDSCQVNNSGQGIDSQVGSGASGNLVIRNIVRGCTTPYVISTNTMSGPIITYGSGAVTATGVITNTSPWANFAY